MNFFFYYFKELNINVAVEALLDDTPGTMFFFFASMTHQTRPGLFSIDLNPKPLTRHYDGGGLSELDPPN